ncbi:hypothetical protein XENOCAPTIV_026690, partial [Xenoophorus captivus]
LSPHRDKKQEKDGEREESCPWALLEIISHSSEASLSQKGTCESLTFQIFAKFLGTADTVAIMHDVTTMFPCGVGVSKVIGTIFHILAVSPHHLWQTPNRTSKAFLSTRFSGQIFYLLVVLPTDSPI